MTDFFKKGRAFWLILAALAALSASPGVSAQEKAAESGGGATRGAGLPADALERMRSEIFEYNLPSFDNFAYSTAVESLFKAFEKNLGSPIKRGAKGKVGIKIYTNSGAGLTTPKPLVDAVIEQLRRRGYEKKDITIVDMSRRRLRESGFLPKLSQIRAGAKDDYNGVNVVDIDGGKFFDKMWYYDNPLTPKSVRSATAVGDIYDPELRKSYLPVPLFLTVDFWINLPVVTDMEGLGVCAALGNISIWNMSNNERFLKSPANASMAAAEVCAIPEMRNSLLMTIMSMECGQFVGGAVFNSRCTLSERKIYMSADPVVLDFIAWEYINKYRRSFGFEPISTMPALLNYCKELKIGDWDLREHRRIYVSAPKRR